MNDFDRFLERELRLMLEPVVASVPPARGERQKPPEAVEPPQVDLAETVPVETAPVAIPVASAP